MYGGYQLGYCLTVDCFAMVFSFLSERKIAGL